MTQPPMTQRERNRIDTWNAVHEAACAIVWEHGPGATTVEAIAEQAGVSRRTFFNYFPTKEDAILGSRTPEVPQEAIDRFRMSAEDELTRVVLLFVAVVRTAMPQSTSGQRRLLVAEFPSLRKRVGRLLAEVEGLVTDVLEAHVIKADGDGNNSDDGAQVQEHDGVTVSPTHDADRLEALLMLAGVIAKFALNRHHASSEDDPGVFLTEAIAMFRHVVDTTR